MFNRDVTQAYLKAEALLGRDVFINTTEYINLPTDEVMKVERALSRITKTGLY